MNKVEKKNNVLNELFTTNNPQSNKKLFFTHTLKNFLQKKMFKVETIKEKKASNADNNSQGYWFKSEHYKFIEALYLYDCNWKKIQNHLRNRTYNQVRSHAQKFYLKLKTFKDEQLGLDFTSNDVKSLKDIIKIIKDKEKEPMSDSKEKLLYIISEKLSFGKTPRKHEEKIVIEIKEEEPKNNLENKNINININNINIINKINLINNTNYINNSYQINFDNISKDFGINNDQVTNSLKYFDLSPSSNESEEDYDNISIISNTGLNDLILLKKIMYIKDIIGY